METKNPVYNDIFDRKEIAIQENQKITEVIIFFSKTFLLYYERL